VHAPSFDSVLSDILGPRRALRAQLARGRIWVARWQEAMSGRGQRDAHRAFAAPDPISICAAGVASLCKTIRGKEPDPTNVKAGALCHALLRLSGDLSEGPEPSERWKTRLRSIRRPPKDAPWAVADEAIGMAGGPVEWSGSYR
jgi:hypothetical protein